MPKNKPKPTKPKPAPSTPWRATSARAPKPPRRPAATVERVATVPGGPATVTVIVPAELATRLRARAAERRTSLSTVVCDALRATDPQATPGAA